MLVYGNVCSLRIFNDTNMGLVCLGQDVSLLDIGYVRLGFVWHCVVGGCSNGVHDFKHMFTNRIQQKPIV